MSSKPNNRSPAAQPAREQAAGADQPEEEMAAPNQMSQNHIYVGKKPVMSYAMSALIQLSQNGEVIIKARGLAIGRAVDVAEIVTKRLGNGAFAVKNIAISTEQVKSVDTGEMRNVSSIEILVAK
ncbi:MAG: DNA-binding protein Alba [Thaumarchaeota archaeon]|nr:DNA-binding protein Alba [Nitrososphaerota archaeon]